MELDQITASLSIPTALLAGLLLALIFFFLLRSSSHTSRRLPPSPPSLPIIGHLHHLLLSGDPPHHAFARLAAGLGGTPILHLRLGRVPTVIVSTPRLAREVLKVHDAALASRPRLLSAEYLSFGCSDVTFSPLGSYWRQARRICVTELLAPRRVATFSRIRGQEVDRLLRSVASSVAAAHGGAAVVDMSERVFTLANDVLCRVAFGRRFSEEKAASASGGGGKKRLTDVLEETQALFAGFDVSEFFPGLGWVNVVTGLRRRLEKNLADLRAVCEEIIAEHQLKGEERRRGSDHGGGGEEEEDREGREDFVDVLLRVQKIGDLEVPITDDNLKALVLDMFVAGTDTTSATLEWVMTELARHPGVIKKLRDEVRAAVCGGGGEGKKEKRTTVEEDDLPRLHYLKAIVKETLRVHPPVPLLVPRESIEEVVIDGYVIPAKSRILINTYAMNRDPENWDAPLEFRPERFYDAATGDGGGGDVEVKGGQGFELLPFGGGRRGCPGNSFAIATIELALARMMLHFDWALPPGVAAADVDLGEVFGLATRKRTPLHLVATASTDFGFQV